MTNTGAGEILLPIKEDVTKTTSATIFPPFGSTQSMEVVVAPNEVKQDSTSVKLDLTANKARETMRELAQLDVKANESNTLNSHQRRSSLPINPIHNIQLDLPQIGEAIAMERAVSLDTGINQEKGKISGTMSVRQVSFEVLTEEKTLAKGQKEEHKEEIAVPPREVLLRMPLYSTPLTLEATNNAYRDFVNRLIGMGFESGQAECAVTMTKAESVEVAVEFVFQHPDGLWHRFRPKDKTIAPDSNNNLAGDTYKYAADDVCGLCTMQYWRHYIDPNGDKIDALPTEELRSGITEEKTPTGNANATTSANANANANSTATGASGSQHPTVVALLQQEANRPKPEGPTQLCGVCFDEKPPDQFYLAPCGHNYCIECLETHYKIKTQDADVLKVGCIDPKCEREIPEDEFVKFLRDPELLSKFHAFKKNKLLMLNPSARFCLRPNCEGHAIGSRWQPKLICPVCSTAQCFNCSQAWHGYFTGCNNNDAIGDIGLQAWALNKDVQKCPRCRVRIEKNEGCNHMTCASCTYEFCWICRGPYNSEHFQWWNIFGCPGAQHTPQFCRCPSCFPRWLNRVLIILCFLAVVVPLGIAAGVLWIIAVFFLFCIRCNGDCGRLDPCDCVD